MVIKMDSDYAQTLEKKIRTSAETNAPHSDVVKDSMTNFSANTKIKTTASDIENGMVSLRSGIVADVNRLIELRKRITQTDHEAAVAVKLALQEMNLK